MNQTEFHGIQALDEVDLPSDPAYLIGNIHSSFFFVEFQVVLSFSFPPACHLNTKLVGTHFHQLTRTDLTTDDSTPQQIVLGIFDVESQRTEPSNKRSIEL